MAAAVAAIFLLALSALGDHNYFQQNNVIGFLVTLGLITVAAVAAMVGIYWIKRTR